MTFQPFFSFNIFIRKVIPTFWFLPREHTIENGPDYCIDYLLWYHCTSKYSIHWLTYVHFETGSPEQKKCTPIGFSVGHCSQNRNWADYRNIKVRVYCNIYQSFTNIGRGRFSLKALPLSRLKFIDRFPGLGRNLVHLPSNSREGKSSSDTFHCQRNQSGSGRVGLCAGFTGPYQWL